LCRGGPPKENLNFKQTKRKRKKLGKNVGTGEDAKREERKPARECGCFNAAPQNKKTQKKKPTVEGGNRILPHQWF